MTGNGYYTGKWIGGSNVVDDGIIFSEFSERKLPDVENIERYVKDKLMPDFRNSIESMLLSFDVDPEKAKYGAMCAEEAYLNGCIANIQSGYFYEPDFNIIDVSDVQLNIVMINKMYFDPEKIEAIPLNERKRGNGINLIRKLGNGVYHSGHYIDEDGNLKGLTEVYLRIPLKEGFEIKKEPDFIAR